MRRKSYILWGITIAVVLAIGIFVKTNRPPKEQVLSRQDYPEVAPFPVRKAGAEDPVIRAKYVMLMDADSFYPLFKKEAYVSVPIASTTKMMTALVVMERYQLSDIVTISRQATLQIGSDTNILTGEQLTVLDLLKALLIQSGNDAAYALAEHGQSVETFVSWMNAKAQAIGMRSTAFKDPAGLDDEGKSTAFDLALLASHLIAEPRVREIVSIPEATITSVDGRQSHILKNSNRLVTEEMYFPGILGLKTGFTPAAGHTLVSAATRSGHTLISVILFTHDDTKEASARESAKLLSWGFDSHLWVAP